MRAARTSRLPRSAYSRSTRLRSFLGSISSSSAALASTSPARASAAPWPASSSAARGALGDAAPVQRRAREAPPPRRAAPAPSPSASARRALAVAERQPRARAARCSARRRGASSARRARPAAGASKRTGWQRDGDRRQHVPRAVGEQQQVRERRRLLERLEHPVGRLVVHRVDALDHEHAPARLERRARRGGDDRLVDVGRRASRRAPLGATHVRSGCTPCSTRSRASVGIGRAVGQQRGGERARDRALARPGRAVEQVGVAGRAVGRQRRRRGRRARGDGRSVPGSTHRVI